MGRGIQQPLLIDQGPLAPEGFVYQEGLILSAEQTELVGHIEKLPLKEFEFHGYTGKRRTMSFGQRYDFAAYSLQDAEPLPEFLYPLRDKAASFARVDPKHIHHVLVTEYKPGTTIGWHRDKAVFEDVVGISLLSSCRFRFRRKAGGKWDRLAVILEPRSAYLLRGPARTEWEHSIPAVEDLRYSITFRTLRN
jgi:alkylated DNA repair dioxygenase AlkB